jgi:hypothetical protein
MLTMHHGDCGSFTVLMAAAFATGPPRIRRPAPNKRRPGSAGDRALRPEVGLSRAASYWRPGRSFAIRLAIVVALGRKRQRSARADAGRVTEMTRR